MNIQALKKKLTPVFKRYGVESAYLFGSQSAKTATSSSDVDIAVLLPFSFSKKKRFDTRMALITSLSRLIRKDLDLIVMNDTKSLFFKYCIICSQIIYKDRFCSQL